MKVLTPGHCYELMCYDPPRKDGDIQTLRFIEKVPAEQTPSGSHPDTPAGTLVTLNNGTTNEEVLLVLIDRLKYLQEKFPCRDTAIVITKLEESQMWLERRTRIRQQQNVEGKQLAHKE
jgi:hypothetical protein